jgi:hypothetical protein
MNTMTDMLAHSWEESAVTYVYSIHKRSVKIDE